MFFPESRLLALGVHMRNNWRRTVTCGIPGGLRPYSFCRTGVVRSPVWVLIIFTVPATRWMVSRSRSTYLICQLSFPPQKYFESQDDTRSYVEECRSLHIKTSYMRERKPRKCSTLTPTVSIHFPVSRRPPFPVILGSLHTIAYWTRYLQDAPHALPFIGVLRMRFRFIKR